MSQKTRKRFVTVEADMNTKKQESLILAQDKRWRRT